MARVVIVGGGGVGDATAFTLRKRGFDGEIVIVSADHDRPYDRPYLSKEFVRGEIDVPKVFLHTEEDFAAQRVELRLDTRAMTGSLHERRLELDGGGHLAFDVLVLGLGGTPRRLPNIPAAQNVHTLRSLRDSRRLRDALHASSRLLLIVEALPVPLQRALGHEVGEIYAQIHRSHGVDLRAATTISEWHSDGDRVVGATLSDGRREAFDLVLVAVGIEPNLELPR